MTLRRLALLLLLLPACSSKDASGPSGEHHHYVVASTLLPTDTATATAYGVDLDGDASVDNQVGDFFKSFIAAGGFDFNVYSAAAIANGDVLLLADLQADDLVNASRAGFTIYRGADPSPAPCTNPNDPLTCGQHLTGTGSFSVQSGTDTDATVLGDVAGGAFETSEPGHVLVSFAIGATPVHLRLERGRVKIAAITPTTLQGGAISGAVTSADVQGTLVPALHTVVSEVTARDCTGGAPPSCGCMASSEGIAAMNLFDDDDDCAVSLAEFQANTMVAALLAPDLDLDDDGTNDAHSVGVGFTAVAGTFTQP